MSKTKTKQLKFDKGDLVVHKDHTKVLEIMGYSLDKGHYETKAPTEDKIFFFMEYELIAIEPENTLLCSECKTYMTNFVVSKCEGCGIEIHGKETGQCFGTHTEGCREFQLLQDKEVAKPEDLAGGSSQFFMILDPEVDKIDNSQFQPRSSTDPTKNEELRNSLQASGGNIEPITCWYVDNVHIIIAGHRRVQELLGLRLKINAMVHTNLTEEESWTIAVATNVKEDMLKSDLIVSVGRLNNFGLDQVTIHKRLGMAQSTVNDYLSISDCDRFLLQKIDSGELGISHSVEIARLPKKSQVWFAKQRISNGWTAQKTKHYIDLWLSNEFGPKYRKLIKEGKENWDTIERKIEENRKTKEEEEARQKELEMYQILWSDQGITVEYAEEHDLDLDWLLEQSILHEFIQNHVKDYAELIQNCHKELIASIKDGNITWVEAWEEYADRLQLEEHKKEFGPIMDRINTDIRTIMGRGDTQIEIRLWTYDRTMQLSEIVIRVDNWLRNAFGFSMSGPLKTRFMEESIDLKELWGEVKDLIAAKVDEQSEQSNEPEDYEEPEPEFTAEMDLTLPAESEDVDLYDYYVGEDQPEEEELDEPEAETYEPKEPIEPPFETLDDQEKRYRKDPFVIQLKDQYSVNLEPFTKQYDSLKLILNEECCKILQEVFCGVNRYLKDWAQPGIGYVYNFETSEATIVNPGIFEIPRSRFQVIEMMPTIDYGYEKPISAAYIDHMLLVKKGDDGLVQFIPVLLPMGYSSENGPLPYADIELALTGWNTHTSSQASEIENEEFLDYVSSFNN